MSGHSKFANIKHKKAKNDAQKGKIFTKLGREIVVAVKAGGPDPNLNASLADIITKSKANNMPNDTISRAIKKASGEDSAVTYERNTYEGYGPNGVAVIVECLTDNKNRTASNVRHAFSKFGGNMGTTGCVSFMFEKKGQIIIENDGSVDEDELMMLALEVGADDVSTDEDAFTIETTTENYHEVNKALEEAGYTIFGGGIDQIPSTTVVLSEEDKDTMEKMLDMLEEDDDVQEVFHNWEMED